MIWDRHGGTEGAAWLETLRAMGLTCQQEAAGPAQHWVITDAPPDEIGMSYFDHVFIRDHPKCRLFVGRGDGAVQLLSIVAKVTGSWLESEHGASITSAEFKPYCDFIYLRDEAALRQAFAALASSRPDVDDLLNAFDFQSPPASADDVQEQLEDLALDDELMEAAVAALVQLFSDAGLTLAQ